MMRRLFSKNGGVMINKARTNILGSIRQAYPFCEIQRDEIETDVLVVGGGPAGLAAAIKLQQLASSQNRTLDVTLIDKGPEIGAHILSGCCFQADGLTDLIPDWKEKGAPVHSEVTEDRFLVMTEKSSLRVPNFLLPNYINNHGNYNISLGELCAWLGKQAEELGVNVYTGFAANQVLYNKEETQVEGVILNDVGISKLGKKKEGYQPGNVIKAKLTVLAEGCRGSLSERILKKYNLRHNPQHYGLGVKEVWEVPESNPNFKDGLVQHTTSWPLDMRTYGGTFMYHMKPNLIHVGIVIGLDYENPYLNPYEEFQRWKTHPHIRKFFEGGRCISYGARTLNEGGYYAIPHLSFPGGVLVGDAAGFLNVSKIKGTNNAIISGITAAETIFEDYVAKESQEYGVNLSNYDAKMKKSKVVNELYQTRNFQGAFSKGLLFGLSHAFVTNLMGGRELWKFSSKLRDTDYTQKAANHKKIEYPKHDGKLTFDLLDNLARSGTNHDHDQPSHLKIKPDKKDSPLKSYNEYAAPEERFCPAKVYEFIKDENDKPKLQINAQNCVHCKACSIKMIDEYIDWNVPQGGEGPKYMIM